MIKGYHTDNDIFRATEFMEELLKNQQKIRFSESGTLHQNGTSEHAIKMLVTMTNTMLMHTDIICLKDTMSNNLFPMSMDYDVWV